MLGRHFNKGDEVEVIKDHDNSKTSWYVATVLSSPAKNKKKFYVEYQTLMDDENGSQRLREYINASNVRPLQPRELHRCFKLSEIVDAFHHNRWRQGTVTGIFVNSRYLVSLDGTSEQLEFEQSNLRLHREWDDGSWVPPLEEQKKLSEMEVKPRKLKIKIKCIKKTLEPKFSKGTMVEVSSDEEGFRGSWYTAIIIGSIGNDKFLVEYQTLKTDDESNPLSEEAYAQYIRPCPPEIQRSDRFEQPEDVDAWYNDGWWVGVISKVLDNLKYIVYFRSTNEELEFEHSNLRLHQDWIDGKWVISSKKDSSEWEVKSREVKLAIEDSGRTSDAKLRKGTTVEVKSNEEGFWGSWYTAVIVGSIENGKFLVEYQMLKTEDETRFLKEEADAPYIRPCPPEIPVDRFKQFEEVDAWYNEGWWVGIILKVLDGLKYSVYFSTTKEELEFGHSNLRLHQEWTDGKWVIYPRKRSCELEVKSREEKLKIQYGGITSEAIFSKGTMVEVESDEEGFRGSWYTAVIVGSIGNGKFLVEYQTLKTDNETELLKEEVDAPYIRPCPPKIQRVDRFKQLEEVDAWYNDGWWVGLISKVLHGLKYIVYFRTTNEESEFEHSNLRPHQEWTDGNWVLPGISKL